MKRLLISTLLVGWLGICSAAPGVKEWSVEAPLHKTYDAVYQALEAHRFFVVFEVDMHKNLAGFAERWGENYNRNKLEGIRSMVFCNGWYANAVGNQDPAMLALCPLKVTLIHKAGTSRVLFVRPTHVAQGSKATEIARDLEEAVSEAIEAGIQDAVQ